MTIQNVRSSISIPFYGTFDAYDGANIYVIGSDGNLWLEHAPSGGWYSPISGHAFSPPPREHVDGNVAAIQALNLDSVFVLGTDGNLWLEHAVDGKFGRVPPPREHVDGNVHAFQALDAETVCVLGTDGNLWLEHAVNGKFGQVPPPREQIDGNVRAFQMLDADNVCVLGSDGNLWFENAVNGKFGAAVPPPRQQIDGNVRAFQVLDSATFCVLGDDGNLWLEHLLGSFVGARIPPPRERIDGSVRAFQIVNAETVCVLADDGSLWLEHAVNGKFGQIPPPRTQLLEADLPQQSDEPPGTQVHNWDFQLLSASIMSFYSLNGWSTQQGGNLGWQVGAFTDRVTNPPQSLWVDENVRIPVTEGTVTPDYLILTLVYAPPGTSGSTPSSVPSSVQYIGGTNTGTKTSATQSFKDGVVVSGSVGALVASVGAEFSFSETSTDTSSVEIKKSESFTLTVKGPTTDGINHDEDYFYLWLNPQLIITIDARNNATWELGVNGQEMNILYVTVGELKDPTTMAADVKAALDSAGLTSADYANILRTNPFASGATTIDPNRYLPLSQALTYRSGADSQSQAYNLTTSETNVNSESSQVQYSVSASFSAGIKDVSEFKTTVSWQWTNSAETDITTGTSTSATVTIGQPSANWNGSTEVLVYLDTVYNTFMFAFPG